MDSNIVFYDVGKDITFQSFCEVCQKLKTSKTQQKYQILRDYFDECRKIKDSKAHPNLYPLLRLLLPNAERERGSYGIKEATFARLYIRILNLPKDGNDAIKLTNYKAPSASVSNVADFAEVAFWVLKSRCTPSLKVFTLDDVNTHLDKIVSFHHSNSPRAVDDELTKLTNSMPVAQQKWLIRIILKDLKLGMGQTKILSSFHSDAPDLFDTTSSLEKVCNTLYSHNIHLHEIEVDMFSAFRPMLSEKLDITKINSLMKKDDLYYMETKFDGERFQIHMKNGNYKYFSRNGFDYTENYGETYHSDGMLTKHLLKSIDPSVFNFIIDGEMMGWHKIKKVFSSKGINFDVKKISDQSSYQPCFCAFDILFYNDIVLTNKPLNERLKYLDTLFKDEEGIIIHSKRTEVKEGDKVLEALNKAIDNQEEGIVIKRIDSLYKPNNRKAGWYKIKPEYTEGVMNELDLLIIGGYYADNKRYGMVGSVLLGVADSSIKIDNEPAMFYACGKVKLTIVKDEYEELSTKLQPHWQTVLKDTYPPCIRWTKDKPDVWIDPKNSYILQVKASELVRSNQFSTDFTLRFPRVEKIRYDKPWYDCLTNEEFSNLTQNSHGVEKLTSKNIKIDDLSNTEVSPRKKAFMINNQFRPVSTVDIQEKSGLLLGKEFCIVTGTETLSKSDIEKKVLENGGKIVQNPGNNTFCILAGNINARIANTIKSGKFNIATIDWFLRTLDKKFIASGNLLEWTPQDLIGVSEKTAEEFIYKFDEYDDSYTTFATRESLIHSMKRVEESIYLTTQEFNAVDQVLFGGMSPYSFFRNHVIYFHNEENLVDNKAMVDLLRINVQLYAGIWTEIMTDETTHIIIESFDKDSVKKIMKEVNLHCSPVILTIDWLEDCFREKCMIDCNDYKINVSKIL